MNQEEVNIHLAGYRPEIYRDDDPRIAEALRVARADPELSAWLEQEIAFDHRLAATLRNVPSDSGAIEAIIRTARADSRPRFRRFPGRGLLLAAAAVLALGGFLVKFFLFPPPVQFAGSAADPVPGFRDAMAYVANQRFVLNKTSPDLEVARRWLVENECPVYPNTPENIVRYKGMGCKAIDWHGTKVSLVCFLNERDDIVHLFVVEVADLADASEANLAKLQRLRGLETQGWRDERLVYLFVGSDPDVSLAGLL